MNQYFSDFFEVLPEHLEDYEAFNISLISDLPLFIDPFLLFNSDKEKHRKLHDEIIAYLAFLRDKSANANLDKSLIRTLYRFPEIKQTWLGFSVSGNKGSGLGSNFADALHDNLNRIFKDFGQEQVTQGSHLEKLCLISDGVGKDSISDFVTNLIHGFLLEYTQEFAITYLKPGFRKQFKVHRTKFNSETETWECGIYELPLHKSDYVLITPKDILARDDTWINKADLLNNFDLIPSAISNESLRAQVNNYFLKVLIKHPKTGEGRTSRCPQ